MNIRKAEQADLEAVLGIYGRAREFMRESGNPEQWAGAYPPRGMVEGDIARGNLYVLTEGGARAGVFCFFIGEEEDYREIRDGAWPNDAPYGVIHRVASSGVSQGVVRASVRYCAQFVSSLRIDTHRLNRPMRRALEDEGFAQCGIIKAPDGTDRIAYQRAARLSDPLKLSALTLKNRVSIPPMVMFGFSGDDGVAHDNHVDHYRALARGGAGLIVQEATCVSREGRLAGTQLGLWDDRHIEGLSRITRAVHDAGAPIVVQIHHAGIRSISPEPLCPDAYRYRSRSGEIEGRKMTKGDIARIREEFVRAAIRAAKAGYDGVELHGCHQYLLCQFLSRRVNRRDDAYGKNPALFVLEVLDAVKQAVPADFIVGIRLGGFEPTLEDALGHAALLEAHGIDYLNISYGFTGEDEPFAPEGYPLKDVIYAAARIKRAARVPVFAVNGIKTPADAAHVLAVSGADMVSIGRSALVDADWPNKALAGEDPKPCLACPRCRAFESISLCPGRKHA